MYTMPGMWLIILSQQDSNLLSSGKTWKNMGRVCFKPVHFGLFDLALPGFFGTAPTVAIQLVAPMCPILVVLVLKLSR